MSNQRIDYLDSVRGLAAFSVVIYHILSAHWGWMRSVQWSFCLFNGSDAVSLFFVLSGIVLSYRYFQKPDSIQTMNYKTFVIARAFRILPAYWIMIIIYYLYAHSNELYTSAFLSDTLHNKYGFIEEFVLMRDKHELYLPSWTLAVELGLSLLLPMFVLVYQQQRQMFWCLFGVVIFIGKSYTSLFSFHFLLGIAIAANFSSIQQYNFKESRWYAFRHALYLLIFILFSWRHLVTLYPLPEKLIYLQTNLIGIDTFHFTALGAAGIFLVVINSPRVQRILMIKPLLFLGKISYSLYLVHWLVLGFFMNHFDEIMTHLQTERNMLLTFLAFGSIVSIVLAILLYYLVEKPFISIGRKLIQHLA